MISALSFCAGFFQDPTAIGGDHSRAEWQRFGDGLFSRSAGCIYMLVNAAPARPANFASLAGAVGGTVVQGVAKLVLF